MALLEDRRRRAYCERIHNYRDAVGALRTGYHGLFDRAVQVLGSDDRVRGLWLSGSLARGTADAASDLDLLVAVADKSHDDFVAAWRTWLGQITPTVLAQEQWFAKGSFWSITPNFERFDVVVETASQVASTLFPVRTVVFDHDGLTATLPPERQPGPDRATLAKLIEDWFHFSAMLETVLWREDWLLAAEHLHFLRDLLYRLYVERNKPAPAMGLKRWSEKLTPQQRQTVESLPTAATSRDEVVSAHLAFSSAFLGTAGAFAEELNVAWPTQLAEAAEAHLRAVLERDDVYPS